MPAPLRRDAGAFEGAREVFGSRYLLCIVAIVVAYEFAAAVTDFVINVVFERAFESEVVIAQMYRRLGWIVRGTALFSQIVIVPRLLPLKRAALLVSPAIMIATTLAFALFPAVAMAMMLDRAGKALSSGTSAAFWGRMKASIIPIGSLIAASVLSGCVARDKYDAALNDATQAQAKLEANQKLEQEIRRENRAEMAQLRQELAEAQISLASAQQEVGFAGGIAVTCGEALDESTTLNEGLKAELERLGRDVNDLAAVKAELTGSLSQARAGLEELRSAQAASDAQAALFRDVATRLRRMLDSEELDIALRSGRMVLVLRADILFDAGKASVGAKGRQMLGEVGHVLGTVRGKRFQVSGHTDADPIRVSGFESNWQLSSARALEVVEILIRAGVSPAMLSAAGYAEFDPIAANDSAANKARNRRIEIALQPNIDQLVEVPH